MIYTYCYKRKLEEFVSPRNYTGLRLFLRIYLQQHKHGHLPYVPAEIFITDACGFHLSNDFITFQRLAPRAGTYKRHQQCPKMCCFFL